MTTVAICAMTAQLRAHGDHQVADAIDGLRAERDAAIALVRLLRHDADAGTPQEQAERMGARIDARRLLARIDAARKEG